MSLGSGKQKALLVAGLRSAGRGASRSPQELAARYGGLLCPGGSGGGAGRASGGALACCLASGAFPPTSLGVTLAGVHSPRAIARLP